MDLILRFHVKTRKAVFLLIKEYFGTYAVELGSGELLQSSPVLEIASHVVLLIFWGKTLLNNLCFIRGQKNTQKRFCDIEEAYVCVHPTTLCNLPLFVPPPASYQHGKQPCVCFCVQSHYL